MKLTIKNSFVLAIAAASLSACGGGSDYAEDGEVTATDEPAEEVAATEEPNEEVAAATSADEVSKLSCEPLGDVAVSIEPADDGQYVLVTHMQSENAPDAEPNRLALEPTGMSAGRAGVRLADEGSEFIVWMMDDGTATVNTGDLSVNCKA